MAVGIVASASSGSQASVASFNISASLGTGARCGIVFVATHGTGDIITGVTWNGTAMTRLYRAADTDTEPGSVVAYFLDNVTNGAVTVSRTNNTVVTVGYAASVSASGACEVYQTITRVSSTQNTDADTSTTGTGASGHYAIDDGSPGTDSLRYAAYYSGAATPPAANATSSTALQVLDSTALGSRFVRETTAGQGARNVGAATGTTDDWAFVGVAIREVPPPPTGTGAGTQAAQTATGDGAQTFTGTGAAAGTAATADGTAVLTFTGTGAGTGAAATATGEGEHTESAPTGTGEGTQAAQTAEGTGVLTFTGTGAATGAAATAEGAAVESFAGTGAGTGVAATAEGAGTLTFTGTGAATAAAGTASGAGALTFAATGAGTQAAQTAEGQGAETFTGTGSATQAAATASGEGEHEAPPTTGTGAGTQAAQSGSGAGHLPITGTGAGVQARQTASGSGIGGVSEPEAEGFRIYRLPPPVPAVDGAGGGLGAASSGSGTGVVDDDDLAVAALLAAA